MKRKSFKDSTFKETFEWMKANLPEFNDLDTGPYENKIDLPIMDKYLKNEVLSETTKNPK